jgi:PleD family two-component response regulator
MVGIDLGIVRVADEWLAKPIAAQNPQPNSKGLATEKPTVLVVDDEQMIADTTAELLNMFGCRAVRAYSGRTALQICRRAQARLFAR